MQKSKLGEKNTIYLFLILFLFNVIALVLRNNSVILAIKSEGFELGSALIRPFDSFVSAVNTYTNSIDAYRKLSKDYASLRERFSANSSFYVNYKTLIEENKQLKQILEFNNSIYYNNITARVIGKTPEMLHANWIINKGSEHGIRPNSAVLAYQDGLFGLVGRIHELSWSSAVIRPIISIDSYVAGRLSRTRFEGLVQGRGSNTGELRMEYVSRNSRNQISVGDEIITSGLNSQYPPDILIGTISDISTEVYTSSLTLGVSSTIDFSRLEHVYILVEVTNK